MRHHPLAAIALSLSFCASNAASQSIDAAPRGEGIALRPFDRIVNAGGGAVSIRPGSARRAEFLGGAERTMQIVEMAGTLLIECRRPCPNRPEGIVRISAPVVGDVRVTGGGTIEISDGFPPARELNVEIRGGGSIHAAALHAEAVTAAVQGGGSARVAPGKVLHARIRGGGSVSYFGDPEVRSDVDGGGRIRRAGNAPAPSSSSVFRDPRDGQVYETVTIGAQVWLARNLAYLPRVCFATAAGCGVWVYGYDGDDVGEATATAEYRFYGALYDWKTAKEACPPGWHLPADEEWQELEVALGMSPAVAATGVWRGTDEGDRVKLGGGSGLNVAFGGWRTGFGRFNHVGEHANFWCSDEADTDHACERLVGATRSDLGRHTGNKGAGFSVRCIANGREKARPSA